VTFPICLQFAYLWIWKCVSSKIIFEAAKLIIWGCIKGRRILFKFWTTYTTLIFQPIEIAFFHSKPSQIFEQLLSVLNSRLVLRTRTCEFRSISYFCETKKIFYSGHSLKITIQEMKKYYFNICFDQKSCNSVFLFLRYFTCKMWEWNFHKEGLCVIVRSVMPWK